MGILKHSALIGSLVLVGLFNGCATRPTRPPPTAVVAKPITSDRVPTPPLVVAAPDSSLASAAPIPAKTNRLPPVPATPPAAVVAGSLDQFMVDRPAAANLLRRHPALVQWFRTEWNRPAEYPIIWDNQPPHTSPVAENSSSSANRLTSIRVSRKLSPTDQLMALFYETCNSEGRTRINELAAQAARQEISRQAFVDGIVEAEYKANWRLKQTFPTLLPLSREELARDPLYQNVLQIPDTFAKYQAWNLRTKSSNYLHAEELYSHEYDELVKRGLPPVPVP